jgi:hypothetical protein
MQKYPLFLLIISFLTNHLLAEENKEPGSDFMRASERYKMESELLNSLAEDESNSELKKILVKQAKIKMEQSEIKEKAAKAMKRGKPFSWDDYHKLADEGNGNEEKIREILKAGGNFREFNQRKEEIMKKMRNEKFGEHSKKPFQRKEMPMEKKSFAEPEQKKLSDEEVLKKIFND